MYAAQACETGKTLRKALPRAVIVSGGLHAGACPREALEFSDYVIAGDGEISFRKLLLFLHENDKNMDITSIPGLIYYIGQRINKNPLGKAVCNLDMLAPPARYLRPQNYNYSAAGLIKMDLLETSRGCTHACSFCSSGAVYPHQYRVHSPEYVFKEVQRLAESNVKYCMLTDDHLGGDFERLDRICTLIIESGIKIAFFAFIRPFEGRMELKRKMVKAGFILFSYGAESPSYDQIKRYEKGYPDDINFIKKVNAQWLEAGACYVGNSYVFGDVMDSRKTLAYLGHYARKLNPTYIEPLYSQPYAGTKYRQELQQKGLLLNREWSDFTESILLVKHPQVTGRQMKILRALMWLNFFSPKKLNGIFRVPLYFNRVLKIPVLTVLKYMHACDYSLFGSILENRTYSFMNRAMVRAYFTHFLDHFEDSELDMTLNMDQFTDMLGLKPLKKFFNNLCLNINIRDKKTCIAGFVIHLKKGIIVKAGLYPADKLHLGRLPVFSNQAGPDHAGLLKKPETALASLDISLHLLSWFLGSTNKILKAGVFVIICFHTFFAFFTSFFTSILAGPLNRSGKSGILRR
jgi:radical SAM superfamily enzyme YgiQ (UPF0313 family)